MSNPFETVPAEAVFGDTATGPESDVAEVFGMWVLKGSDKTFASREEALAYKHSAAINASVSDFEAWLKKPEQEKRYFWVKAIEAREAGVGTYKKGAKAGQPLPAREARSAGPMDERAKSARLTRLLEGAKEYATWKTTRGG